MGSEVDGRKQNKPPVEGQFKAGKSGNPRGRPKHTSIDIDQLLSDEAKRLVTATGGRGNRIQLTKVEAAAHQLVNKALQGDNKAIAVVLSLAAKLKEAGALDQLTIIRVSFRSSI